MSGLDTSQAVTDDAELRAAGQQDQKVDPHAKPADVELKHSDDDPAGSDED